MSKVFTDQVEQVKMLSLFHENADDQKEKTNYLIDCLASNNKLSDYMGMEILTDKFIEMFDERNYLEYGCIEHHIAQMTEAEPIIGRLCYRWLSAIEKDTFIDWFGRCYEETYLTGSHASKNGQFFTPECVSKLLANFLIVRNTECRTVFDPACGSGRLLLSAAEKIEVEYRKRETLFVGVDIDHIACKMCALNFMSAGLHGIVICQDSLMLSKPDVLYIVNNVDYPVKTGYMSIKVLNDEEEMKKYFNVNGDQWSLDDNIVNKFNYYSTIENDLKVKFIEELQKQDFYNLVKHG